MEVGVERIQGGARRESAHQPAKKTYLNRYILMFLEDFLHIQLTKSLLINSYTLIQESPKGDAQCSKYINDLLIQLYKHQTKLHY